MTMKKLRYISGQPATVYYAWQVEVMLNNFLKNGIEPSAIHVVCSHPTLDSLGMWENLSKKFNEVGFFFYSDTREKHNYIPSIVPHLLKKHFEKHPYLRAEAIFQHDNDMIFTGPVDWSEFLHDDVWYLSDTSPYIGAAYIKSKGYGIYEEMCKIVGIPESLPELNQKDSGGAQYIMKNIDHHFWEKTEKDANELYSFFMEHLNKYPQTDDYTPIQMWTAGMWSQLWNGWYFGHEIRTTPKMDFLWPHEPVKCWNETPIYHNSGVVATSPSTTFCKNKYQQSLPYDIKLEDFNPEICSFKYVEEIVSTAKTTCLLNK